MQVDSVMDEKAPATIVAAAPVEEAAAEEKPKVQVRNHEINLEFDVPRKIYFPFHFKREQYERKCLTKKLHQDHLVKILGA